MPAHVATLVFAIGIVVLFALDRDPNEKGAKALWIPTFWVFICASRSVALWLISLGINAGAPTAETTDQFLEGNPIDRSVLIVLLIISLVVLGRRGQRVVAILRANIPILLFFLYCGLSVLWSDYPDVAFKRWTKAVGDLLMVLIVLTHAEPASGVKRLLSRVGFLVVPLSVLFIKYYPELGRGYNAFSWMPYFTGVTTNKNELGYVCLIFGLGAVWRLLEPARFGTRWYRNGPLMANGLLIAMVLWLFWMANSMTSWICFLMASVLMIQTKVRFLARRRWFLHLLVAMILVSCLSTLLTGVGFGVLQDVGRDPTLTGRTEIWHLVLSMSGNPFFGTGFNSFWLGKRLETIWNLYWWHPRESHNGYIEIYINLGWIGVALLSLVLVTGYRNVVAGFRDEPNLGSIRLAYWIVAVAYNISESAFGMMSLVWLAFLLAITVVPGGWGQSKKPSADAFSNIYNEEDQTPVLI